MIKRMAGIKKRFLSFLVLGWASLSGIHLSAHPHMWIRGQLIPELGRRGLEGVRVVWDIDELTSSYLILDYDTNGDKVLSPREIAEVEFGAFSHLVEVDYYLFAEVNGKRVSSGRAEDFSAAIREGRIIYEFTVPFPKTIRWDDLTDAGLYLFDETYFIDFRPEDMADLTLSYGKRDVVFRQSRMRSLTQGYGMVEFSGLQAVSVNRG